MQSHTQDEGGILGLRCRMQSKRTGYRSRPVSDYNGGIMGKHTVKAGLPGPKTMCYGGQPSSIYNMRKRGCNIFSLFYTASRDWMYKALGNTCYSASKTHKSCTFPMFCKFLLVLLYSGIQLPPLHDNMLLCPFLPHMPILFYQLCFQNTACSNNK